MTKPVVPTGPPTVLDTVLKWTGYGAVTAFATQPVLFGLVPLFHESAPGWRNIAIGLSMMSIGFGVAILLVAGRMLARGFPASTWKLRLLPLMVGVGWSLVGSLLINIMDFIDISEVFIFWHPEIPGVFVLWLIWVISRSAGALPATVILLIAFIVCLIIRAARK